VKSESELGKKPLAVVKEVPHPPYSAVNKYETHDTKLRPYACDRVWHRHAVY